MGTEYTGLLLKGTQIMNLYTNINATQPGEATYQVILIYVHNEMK